MYHMVGGCWKCVGKCSERSSSRGGKDWKKHLEIAVKTVDVQREALTLGQAIFLCPKVKQSSRPPHPCLSGSYIMCIFYVLTYAIGIFRAATHTLIYSWPLVSEAMPGEGRKKQEIS